nr:ribosomal protein L24 [Ahnfeltia fastigiata]
MKQVGKKNIKYKIHVRKGDIIKVISGSYKGKISEVLQVFPKMGKVLVKDINMKTKHSRPKQEGDTGKIIRFESPIHSSNVMLYSTNNKIASRYSVSLNKNNIKQKVLKKTGEIIKSTNNE